MKIQIRRLDPNSTVKVAKQDNTKGEKKKQHRTTQTKAFGKQRSDHDKKLIAHKKERNKLKGSMVKEIKISPPIF